MHGWRIYSVGRYSALYSRVQRREGVFVVVLGSGLFVVPELLELSCVRVFAWEIK